MDADEALDGYVLAEDVDFPQNESNEDVVTLVVDHIADLEWLIGLDDQDMAGMADDAIDACWQLLLIYGELGNPENRVRVLERLKWIADTHPSGDRYRHTRMILRALADRPGL